ncbi:MAG: FAD-dependent monooxygenase [Solirubrobacteraceae bacterium]
MAEVKAVHIPEARYDVVILGGGLAGLSLANQLMLARPQTRVLVTDKRAEAAPESAFKVGESSVEVGAYYYRNIVGMADHLNEQHIRKLGLRFFLPAGDNSDITRRVEFSTPPTPSASRVGHTVFTHQIDRGVFENALFDRAVERGADAYRGWRVEGVEIDAEHEHQVTLSHEGMKRTVAARWVVDATGRFNLLRRQLGLQTDTGHHVNAAWFRLKGGMNYEDWTDDEEWKSQGWEPGVRKNATTHLIGQGYWVWLIRLAPGPISIGVVADPRFHPFEEINEFPRMLAWLREHEPQLAGQLEERLDEVQDFLVIEDFSYGSSEVFSMDRWCLAGEAAAFIDPLYSPGSDFIAYLNTFSGDLIARDLDGEDIEERLDFFNFFFLQLFDPGLFLYRDQYQIFGNPQVMMCKLLNDNIAYFSTLAFLFLHDKMTQLEDLGDVMDVFDTFVPLLGRVQDFYRDWHQIDQRKFEGVGVQSTDFQPFLDAYHDLGEEFELDTMIERAKQKVEVLQAIAVWTFHMGAKHLPNPPDPERPINPQVISLHPEKWEEEGLFSEDGMTLAQALELIPGIEEFDLEARGATPVP